MNSSLVLQPLPSALHNSSNTEGGGWCARLDEFMTVYIRTYCAPKQLQSFILNNIVYAKTMPNPITHTMKETSYKVRCVCFTNATVVCLTNHCHIGEIEDYSHDSWINVILEIIHRVNNFKKHIVTVYIYISHVEASIKVTIRNASINTSRVVWGLLEFVYKLASKQSLTPHLHRKGGAEERHTVAHSKWS